MVSRSLLEENEKRKIEWDTNQRLLFQHWIRSIRVQMIRCLFVALRIGTILRTNLNYHSFGLVSMRKNIEEMDQVE